MSAKVIGVDSKTDLALLKAEGHDFPYVTFATHTPRVGDWVIAVGNPVWSRRHGDRRNRFGSRTRHRLGPL